jgi:hypothetical protein
MTGVAQCHSSDPMRSDRKGVDDFGALASLTLGGFGWPTAHRERLI